MRNEQKNFVTTDRENSAFQNNRNWPEYDL